MKTKDENNALLHIKSKHNGEIPYKYGSKECAKLMHSYSSQRVIEELEKVFQEVNLEDNPYIIRGVILEAIQKLKQQIWKEHTKQLSGC